MNEIWERLRDPQVSTVLVLTFAVVAGLGLIVLANRGVAATLLVPFQMPYVLSGAFVGLSLVGSGCVLLSVHLDRVEAAVERHDMRELQREALRLLRVVTERRQG